MTEFQQRKMQAAVQWQIAIGHMRAALAAYSGEDVLPHRGKERQELINAMLDAEDAGFRCLS